MIPPSANLEFLRSTFHRLEAHETRSWFQYSVQELVPIRKVFPLQFFKNETVDDAQSWDRRIIIHQGGFLNFSEPLFGFMNRNAITTSLDMMPSKGDLPRITQGFSARNRKIEDLIFQPGEVCHIYVSVYNIAVPLRLHLKYGVRSSLLQM